MKRNVGGFDRGFRIALGLAVMGLGVFFRSWWGALGVIPFLTGLFAWCPVYVPFHATSRSGPARVASDAPR
jgi:hypothetical protein